MGKSYISKVPIGPEVSKTNLGTGPGPCKKCGLGPGPGGPLHTVLTPTRKSYRDSCWQFGYQALTGLGWLKNHVKVMGEREILNKSYKFS